MAKKRKGRASPGEVRVHRTDGKYVIDVRVNRADGQQRRIRLVRSTSKECLAAFQSARADWMAGIESKYLTIAELNTAWLATCRIRLAATTHRHYRYLIDRYINSQIGHMEIEKCSTATIRQLIETWQELGLANGTIKLCISVLRQSFRLAIDERMLMANPLDGLNAEIKPPQAQPKGLNDSEIERIYQAAEGHRLRIAITLGLLGLRRGEMCALRWHEDVSSREIIIQRSATGYKDLPFTTPKTRSSYRTLPITPTIWSELERHKAMWPAHYVITDDHGERMNPVMLAAWFKKLAQSVGLNISIHALRHTCAYQMIGRGRPVNEVSAWLGHSSPSITLNTYARSRKSDLTRVAATLDNLFVELNREQTDEK